ncbi:MAG: glycosyltransferase, partial [Flavobacteriales bacterium]
MDQHSPLNILFLSSWYPSEVHQTLGNFVQRHAKAVALTNHVDVLYVTPENKIKESRLVKNSFHGVNEWIQYFPTQRINRWKRKSEFKKLFKHFIATSGKTPDLVHLNVVYPAGNQARLVLNEFDIPFIVTEHWTGYHPEHKTKTSPFQITEMQKTAEKAGTICPVSSHLQKAMTQPPWKFSGPFKVVPNVVDTHLFQPPKEIKRAKRVLHVSSLVDDHKNISGLIEVMSNVMKADKEVTFSIIGDGDIKPYIAKAKQQNLPLERFSIEGEKSLQEIASAMSNHDLFVLFSRYENLPCVILEAFAAGIPVVSSDVGGIS